MRVLIDYRPALRQRSGSGEYTHQLVKALLGAYPGDGPSRALELTLFSSSWKDRFTPPADLAGAAIVDRRVPVRLLNLAWHRLGWPRERIAICPPGAPDWSPRAAAPKDGYVLFFSTLEPRKNVGGLLDAAECAEKGIARARSAGVRPPIACTRPTGEPSSAGRGRPVVDNACASA